MGFSDNAASMLNAIRLTPGWQSACGEIDLDDISAILDEAARVAEDAIAPVNQIGDRTGAVFADGKVRVPAEYHGAYRTIAEGGWIGLEHDPDLGGQGLPLTLFVAVNQLFERASPALMMAAGGSRAAARLLAEWADDETRADWVPALLSGEATATICISEPEAGSDVGRIRTRAEHDGQRWRVSGQKIWISFGDHDLVPRIGHCLLARTGDVPGTRGLSLFLVERGPGVTTHRIEEKLGLHGSPTCALGFQDAPATLIGKEGRGLSQLFTMIRHMRLMVACQGLGTAQACYDAARSHAEERRQGGDPKSPAVPIIEHADVRRQLDEMQRSIDLFRLALVQAAVASDRGPDCEAMARLSGLLLPLVKNFGAELGFDMAAKAILVLGGSGYTTDYPVEQALRDARVFAIYEGTTGMQAQDFLLRKCLSDDGAGLGEMLELALEEANEVPQARSVIEAFRDFFERDVRPLDAKAHLAMAEPFMRAGWIAVQAWMSARIPESASARSFLATAAPMLDLEIARARFAAASESERNAECNSS
jgi:alkylation response protein AidB-like acyl-CoA dehydrogenase